MAKKRLFGLDPKKLDKILSIGTENANGSDIEGKKLSTTGKDTSAKRMNVPSPTASLEIFAEKPGSQIGRYKLLRVLGEGGMGIVYLAEQREPIKRQVAIKVIKPGMDSKRVISRFEAERQALALLDHPNIAHVYDAGMTETGRPYFVMEHVEGASITDYCDLHRLTIKERLRLFQQVCQAVQHAHQKGIIHRDIKPSNILVSMEGDRAVPKIIDFGVAKAVAQPLTERTVATEDSQLLGTPEYMSPEQADMAKSDIDTRSDIYSLGVLLYVLLTGALPFDSDTLRTGGIERIRQIIRETDPNTPSTRLTNLGEEAVKVAQSRRTDIGTLAKRLHKELEWIPLKAMRKERSERYRSASELADDIENYLNGIPLIAGPPSTVYRLRKFVRRNRAFVTGIAAVIAVLIVGIVVSTLFALRAERHARISEAVSDFLRKDLLASVSPARARGREVTVRSLLETVSESLNGKFRNEPLVEASIRETLGWTYRMLGELEASELHQERTLQIRQEQLGDNHPETLGAMGSLGWVYCDQGRFEEAEQLWALKLEISSRVFGSKHPVTLGSMNDLAIVYMDLGRYDKAEKLFLKGLQLPRHVLDEHHQTHRFVGNLGQVYNAQGRYGKAEVQYLKTLEMKRPLLGEDHPYTLLFMGFLAGTYREQGRYDEAEALFLKTLKMQGRVLGEEHPYTLKSIKGLARLYTYQARYEKAEKLFIDALEGFQNARGKQHRDTIDCMNGLAELYTTQHRLDKAESLLTSAVEMSSRTLGEDHPLTLTSINGLAVVYKEQDHYNKSEPLLLEAVAGCRQKLGDTHPHTLASWNHLIELYQTWGKAEQAEQWKVKLSDLQSRP